MLSVNIDGLAKSSHQLLVDYPESFMELEKRRNEHGTLGNINI